MTMLLNRLKNFHQKRGSGENESARSDHIDRIIAHLNNLPKGLYYTGGERGENFFDAQLVLYRDADNVYFKVRYYVDLGIAVVGGAANPIDDPLFWKKDNVIRGIYEAISLDALPNKIHWNQS